jgi:hypothetical protein
LDSQRTILPLHYLDYSSRLTHISLLYPNILFKRFQRFFIFSLIMVAFVLTIYGHVLQLTTLRILLLCICYQHLNLHSLPRLLIWLKPFSSVWEKRRVRCHFYMFIITFQRFCSVGCHVNILVVSLKETIKWIIQI